MGNKNGLIFTPDNDSGHEDDCPCWFCENHALLEEAERRAIREIQRIDRQG